MYVMLYYLNYLYLIGFQKRLFPLSCGVQVILDYKFCLL